MLLSLKENYFIRSMLFNVLKGREVKRSIKGTKYQLYFDAGTNFNFFFSREIEIEKNATANLTQLIRKDFLIYDIGANIGYYTLIFSSLCTDGSILAFEPGIENLKYLRKNVLVNQMKNITVIDKALSNKNGQSVFFEDISTGRSSSLKEDAWHPNASNIKKQMVNTITLDEISIQYGIPDLIKCDVEGFEVEVLKGAENVLTKKPVIFLEVATENRDSVSTILKQFNYNIYNGEESLEKQLHPLNEINCQNILCI